MCFQQGEKLFMVDKTILVTGGAGFVGSHLCERLRGMGHSVISLDNYFTGSEENHIEGVEYITGSTECINKMRLPPVDYVYHLGEYSRVEQSFEDIDLVHKYNIKGTFQVLEFVRRTGAKLIYSGSSTKFADQSDGYVMSPYAWSKATNTELVKKYSEWYGIKYAITYFYNVYGPREIQTGKYATLIAKFADMMRNGEDLTVVSPGNQKRNFTHVEDIVDALILIGEYGDGDEYGIGHPDSYSILEVAEMFGGNIKMLKARRGNRMSAPVVSQNTQNLGWVPRKNLKDWVRTLNV
jgi:UDP-glucose 4-epimerase